MAAQNNVTLRLEAVEELLPSSIHAVPMRTQLMGLGIFSEVQHMYLTLEVHKLALQVCPHPLPPPPKTPSWPLALQASRSCVALLHARLAGD